MPAGCSVMCDEQDVMQGVHPVSFCVASVLLWVILFMELASQLPGTAKDVERACSQQLWMCCSAFKSPLAYQGCMLGCNGKWGYQAHAGNCCPPACSGSAQVYPLNTTHGLAGDICAY